MFNQEKLGLVLFFTGLAMMCAMYVRGYAGFLQAVFAATAFVLGALLYVLAEDK